MTTAKKKPKRKSGRYSVLLIYPDSVGDFPESCYWFVRAKDPDTAVRNAQRQCSAHLKEWDDPEDRAKFEESLAVLLVTRGWNRGVTLNNYTYT